MRLIFAGTPEAAVPSLTALLESRHEVAAVLTRPDAPTGRGRRLRPSPVREAAEAAGIEVLTPATLRSAEVQDALARIAPDAAPVVAYGALVPPAALAIPRLGWINLHFSLLPQWRGAAPAQRAVLAGQSSTGMSVFRLEQGLDTGDILASEPTDIGPLETSGDLLERMAIAGARLLVQTLDALEDGTAHAVPQPEGGVTHAPRLSTAEARLDFTRPAREVSAHIRGMSPAPGAWTLLDGERFKLLSVSEAEAPPGTSLAPGQLLATRRDLFVGTGDAPLALGRIAPPGRRPMAAADWARGAGLREDTAFEPDQDQGTARTEENA